MDLPSCYYCTYNERGYPCRTSDGRFDFDKVARSIVACGRLFGDEPLDQAAYDRLGWSSDCAFEVEKDHPELLFSLVVAAMDACETLQDTAFVAAGVVENMVVKHGPALISRIEAAAAASPKFRYILSGIWSQGGSVDPEVWERIGQAVAGTGRMSNDGRGPWDGATVTVLDDQAALELMKESVLATLATAHV